MKQLTFKNLVVKGKSLSSELIRALLDVYIGDSNMTDTLTSRLRESCPTLFGEDDAIVSKGELCDGTAVEVNTYVCTVKTPIVPK